MINMEVVRLQRDSIILKIPKWMPGYYQIMDYAEDTTSVSAKHRMASL